MVLKEIRPIIFISFLAVYVLTTIVSATSITADVGETWIRWNWNTQASPSNVYIDGILRERNLTMTDYYLQGAEPLEQHNIKLYNSSNTSELLGDLTVSTLYPKAILYIMFGIIAALGVIMLVCRDQVKIVLIGVVAISLAVYVSTLCVGYEGLFVLPLILAIMIGAYLAINTLELIRGKASWY